MHLRILIDGMGQVIEQRKANSYAKDSPMEKHSFTRPAIDRRVIQLWAMNTVVWFQHGQSRRLLHRRAYRSFASEAFAAPV